MEHSKHYATDAYGYKYSNTVWSYDEDIVVFACEPPLVFDIKEQGLLKKISRRPYSDYDVSYEVKEGVLYLRGLSFESVPLYKPGKMFGANPIQPYPNPRSYFYTFDLLPVDYTGIWSIGKVFDFRFWQGDEKANPTPFCPEVYKQNGFIRFENGRVVDIELHPRND